MARNEGAAGLYAYSAALTPVVSDISRIDGTTAGGTSVTLSGKMFGSNPSAFLQNVQCATKISQVKECRSDDERDTHIIPDQSVDGSLWYHHHPVHRGVARGEHGRAKVTNGVEWTYRNLWSAKTGHGLGTRL